MICDTTPTGSVSGPVDRFTLTFDEAILDGSFTAADIVTLSGPGGTIPAPTIVKLSNTQYDVRFAPQAASGTYNLVVGPAISDLTGNLMNQNGDGNNGVPNGRGISPHRNSCPMVRNSTA